jgi:outer membrane scaffolding protein for murein synthesis (MipA/OmpV family)
VLDSSRFTPLLLATTVFIKKNAKERQFSLEIGVIINNNYEKVN